MRAIRDLYLNSGLITKDGYIKVRDGLWIKSGPYERQPIKYLKRKNLPTEEEATEIFLNLDKIVLIQKTCRFSGRIDCTPDFWINSGLRKKFCCIFDLGNGDIRSRAVIFSSYIIYVRRTNP